MPASNYENTMLPRCSPAPPLRSSEAPHPTGEWFAPSSCRSSAGFPAPAAGARSPVRQCRIRSWLGAFRLRPEAMIFARQPDGRVRPGGFYLCFFAVAQPAPAGIPAPPRSVDGLRSTDCELLRSDRAFKPGRSWKQSLPARAGVEGAGRVDRAATLLDVCDHAVLVDHERCP